MADPLGGYRLMADRPALSHEIEVLPGTPVEEAWERFRLFEALHYGLRLCNPFDLNGLSGVVAALAPADGARMVDIACGHGELLIQSAEVASITGTGVDLSPWALVRAVEEAKRRGVAHQLHWVLGRATDFEAAPEWDIVTGLGMSWIWDGFEGSLGALARMAVPGGRLAYGDLQRLTGDTPADVPAGYDPVWSRAEQLELISALGLEALDEIVPTPDAWHQHDQRMSAAVARYVERHPGSQAEQFQRQHHDWIDAHRTDPEHLTWTVWILRRR